MAFVGPIGEIAALAGMPTITLAEMKEVQLMNRVDEKYLMSREQLARLLRMVEGDYYVQRLDGEAVAPYRSLYLETPTLDMYTTHHNRHLRRQKLRLRTYLASGLTFVEVKNKANTGKTRKRRVEVEESMFYRPLESAEVCDFLQRESLYPLERLSPHVENRFERITLVDLQKTSRITIDSGIRFHNHATGLDADLSPLVVMELKHEVGAPLSPMARAMLELRIHPKRMSKYCIGTVLTNPDAKHNRFKQKLRYIDRLVAVQSGF